jgi:hypothetical protein
MSPAATIPTELASVTAVEPPAGPVIDETSARAEERNTSQTSNWGALIKVHPAAEIFPLLEPTELDTLAEDIKANGLKTPIITWFDKDDVEWLIDGRNRLDAMARLGYQFKRVKLNAAGDIPATQLRIIGPVNPLAAPPIVQYCESNACGPWGGPVADPCVLARSYNIERRHLSIEDRRNIAAELLRANPSRSNRSVAAEVKLDDKTVAAVRKEAEARSEIPHVEIRADTKGRSQPATKPKALSSSAEATTAELNSAGSVSVKAAPTATSPKTPAEPRVPASRKREEWIAVTAQELNRDFDGTVEAIGKMLGDCKAQADRLSEVRRTQLLAPIAKALAGPQRVPSTATPTGSA